MRLTLKLWNISHLLLLHLHKLLELALVHDLNLRLDDLRLNRLRGCGASIALDVHVVDRGGPIKVQVDNFSLFAVS